MRKLLILSVLTIAAAGSSGCSSCGRPTCGGPSCGTPSLCSWRPRMLGFGRQQDCCTPAPTCCTPAASCCDSCGGGQMGAYSGAVDGMTAGSMMMPAESSCCH